MKDAKVQSAISHWAPRFVSNGVALADFEEVTGSLERWEDWCEAWSRRAEVHARLGQAAFNDGCKLTDSEHFIRAAIYFHFAKFVFVQDTKQMHAAHMKAVQFYNDGIALARPPGERVEIPFEGKTIKGILRGKGPVLIMAPGLDSTKEEIHAYEQPFLDRGFAILAIDGPGQGEAEYEIPICGDYERAAKAVCDWIATRKDLSKEIAIWGVSLGGYYAPRAAAYEKRIKACIALSGPFEWDKIWDGLPDLTRETFTVRSHSKNQAEAREKAKALTMVDAAPRIACPMYIVAGRQDRLVPASHAERLAQSVSGPVELVMVEDGGHNANNRPYRYRSQSADWLAKQFGLPKS
jgi:2,6-dihydroxypseudooxynicotine hydrolase